MDKRHKYKLQQRKCPRGEHRQEIPDIPHSSIFTNMFPRGRDIKKRTNKWDYIELKSFCTAKENISKIKREIPKLKNIFANDTTDKSLISKIYKEPT